MHTKSTDENRTWDAPTPEKGDKILNIGKLALEELLLRKLLSEESRSTQSLDPVKTGFPNLLSQPEHHLIKVNLQTNNHNSHTIKRQKRKVEDSGDCQLPLNMGERL